MYETGDVFTIQEASKQNLTVLTSVAIDHHQYDFVVVNVPSGSVDCDRLRPLYYPGTNVFLVVFSVVQRDAFLRVASQWIAEVKHWGPKVPILLVGTESDLRNDPETLSKSSEKNEGPVAAEMGHKLARNIRVQSA